NLAWSTLGRFCRGKKSGCEVFVFLNAVVGMGGNANPATGGIAPTDDGNFNVMLLEEQRLQWVEARDDGTGFSRFLRLEHTGEGECGHRAEHRFRARRFHAESFAEQAARSESQLPIVLHQRRPSA